MRLMLLGTQGWIPTPRRETTCLAVYDDEVLFIFDAGTGLSRFLQPPAADLLGGGREVHLLLTHYHLDHVCGLAYLPGIMQGKPVVVHVPDAALNSVDPERGVPDLIRKPFNPGGFREHADFHLQVLHEGDNEVAGHVVRLRSQCHPDTTVAYRLDDRLVLATDTVADAQTADFARDAQVLLHEAWLDGVEESDPAQREFVETSYRAHSSARQVAGIASEAGVGRLVLMHLNPLRDEAYYEQMERAARETFAETHVYPDLQELELDD